jgi:tRNA G18 (ribose-2'-O)-methylase SpoU
MRKLTMDELGRKSVNEFKSSEKNRIIVLLENIRSMHNVGSIFRTADAFLAEAIILCGYTPIPPHRDIHKTALGATETVDWLFERKATDIISHFKQKKYLVYAVEQTTGSIPLHTVSFAESQPLLLVFGNEVEGVSQQTLECCNGAIEIPQQGMKHSLNVSVAAAIVLWTLTAAYLK